MARVMASMDTVRSHLPSTATTAARLTASSQAGAWGRVPGLQRSPLQKHMYTCNKHFIYNINIIINILSPFWIIMGCPS